MDFVLFANKPPTVPAILLIVEPHTCADAADGDTIAPQIGSGPKS